MESWKCGYEVQEQPRNRSLTAESRAETCYRMNRHIQEEHGDGEACGLSQSLVSTYPGRYLREPLKERRQQKRPRSSRVVRGEGGEPEGLAGRGGG